MNRNIEFESLIIAGHFSSKLSTIIHFLLFTQVYFNIDVNNDLFKCYRILYISELTQGKADPTKQSIILNVLVSIERQQLLIKVN